MRRYVRWATAFPGSGFAILSVRRARPADYLRSRSRFIYVAPPPAPPMHTAPTRREWLRAESQKATARLWSAHMADQIERKCGFLPRGFQPVVAQ